MGAELGAKRRCVCGGLVRRRFQRSIVNEGVRYMGRRRLRIHSYLDTYVYTSGPSNG